MRRALPLVVVVLVAGLALGACGKASGTPSPFGSKTAKQILDITTAAMIKAGSVHVVENASITNSVNLSTIIDSSTSQGVTTQVVNQTLNQIRLIGPSLYLYADKAAYQLRFNKANQQLANKWVLIPPTNPNYASIGGGILLDAVVRETVQMGNLKVGGVVMYKGKPAVAIEGVVTGSTATNSSAQTLYISTAKPYLPIGLVAKLTSGSSKGTGTVIFSNWGKAFTVKTPPTYVTATPTDLP